MLWASLFSTLSNDAKAQNASDFKDLKIIEGRRLRQAEPIWYDTIDLKIDKRVAWFSYKSDNNQEAERIIQKNNTLSEDSLWVFQRPVTAEEKKELTEYGIINWNAVFGVTTYKWKIILLSIVDWVNESMGAKYSFYENWTVSQDTRSHIDGDVLKLKAYLEKIIPKIDTGEVNRKSKDKRSIDKSIKKQRKIIRKQ